MPLARDQAANKAVVKAAQHKAEQAFAELARYQCHARSWFESHARAALKTMPGTHLQKLD
eukprot:1158550-Pelagomonas_calceolata.AAC.3